MKNLIHEEEEEEIEIDTKTFEKICKLQKLVKQEATLRGNCKINI